MLVLWLALDYVGQWLAVGTAVSRLAVSLVMALALTWHLSRTPAWRHAGPATLAICLASMVGLVLAWDLPLGLALGALTALLAWRDGTEW